MYIAFTSGITKDDYCHLTFIGFYKFLFRKIYLFNMISLEFVYEQLKHSKNSKSCIENCSHNFQIASGKNLLLQKRIQLNVKSIIRSNKITK